MKRTTTPVFVLPVRPVESACNSICADSLPELAGHKSNTVSCRVCTGVSMVCHPALHRDCCRQRGRQGCYPVGSCVYTSGTGRNVPKSISSEQSVFALRDISGGRSIAGLFFPFLLMFFLLTNTGFAQESRELASPTASESTGTESVTSSQRSSPASIGESNGTKGVEAGNTGVCTFNPEAGPELVIIPPGKFLMGSDQKQSLDADDDEFPQHEVVINHTFALSRCEVTVAEFSAFIESRGYTSSAENAEGCATLSTAFELVLSSTADWRNPFPPEVLSDNLITARHPVTCVSWNDAVAYIEWLNLKTGFAGNSPWRYRLPTEAEFEYALRATATTEYPWVYGSQCDHANAADESLQTQFSDVDFVADCTDDHVLTAPVGSYTANNFGLYDMSGNVWEWVSDCWHNSYVDAPLDGSSWGEADNGDCSRRVLRGGGWNSGPEDLRSAYRSRIHADGSNFVTGFRLARTLGSL